MLHLNSIMILLIPVVVINSPSMPTTFKFHYDSINSELKEFNYYFAD
mgnify:CR=1 FL=1